MFLIDSLFWLKTKKIKCKQTQGRHFDTRLHVLSQYCRVIFLVLQSYFLTQSWGLCREHECLDYCGTRYGGYGSAPASFKPESAQEVDLRPWAQPLGVVGGWQADRSTQPGVCRACWASAFTAQPPAKTRTRGSHIQLVPGAKIAFWFVVFICYEWEWAESDQSEMYKMGSSHMRSLFLFDEARRVSLSNLVQWQN